MLMAVSDLSLHTLMNYFLCHLAMVEAGFTLSVVLPLLANLHSTGTAVARASCARRCVL